MKWRWVATFVAVAVVSLAAPGRQQSAFACWPAHSIEYDYWQHHATLYWNGSHWVEEDWWSLDGQCDLECDGNTYCTGDTHVDNDTIIDQTVTGDCDCSPPPP